MEKYPLAKLVQWSGSGGVAGRKRLQKVIFFLQKAGCPFGADYTLHHYGPYSRDVAETCDELVASGLLEEKPEMNTVGTQYTYKVAATGEAALTQTEQRFSDRASALNAFQSLAKELLQKDLWELELGSTILYFHEKSSDWDEAVRRACEFKKVDRQKEPAAPAAEALAKKVLGESRVMTAAH
jgi:hypothetical protein